MDCTKRRRLKLLGHIRIERAEDVPADVLALVDLPDYQARVERVAFIDVVAFDWNCPQHITQRYTLAELEQLRNE